VADRSEYWQIADFGDGQARFDPLRFIKAIASLVLEWIFSFS
jgi:hypothetical protein